MIRRIWMAAFALLIAVPLSAQAPAGLQVRLDESTNANDPDDVPDVKVTAAPNGFQVVTGPAAVVWNPANTTTGAYTLKGTFTLLAPSSHANYYGLVFGGSDLAGPMQNYLYFLVAQNGTFIVKHRASDSEADVKDVVGRTAHASVVTPDASGKSVNALEVRVGASDIAFVVNGTVVHTAPKTGLTAKTDGIWGARVNHVIPGVVVEGLSVTK